jgi:hypothetical protein
MKTMIAVAMNLLLATRIFAADAPDAEQGFVSLFDGKTLDGWKVGENAGTFQVRDGMIVANGPTAHLYYVGDVAQHDFKNFHFRADVMTFPHANSGIYFHTKYQELSWPNFGIESQVNNSHKDTIRTGSLWGIKNIHEAPAKDNVWFTQEIIVQGRHIVVKVDGKTIVNYTLPEEAVGENKLPSKRTWLPSGTFALQGHDPGSKTCFKNIRVKVLPEGD